MPKKKKRPAPAVDASHEEQDEVQANGDFADVAEGLVVVGTYEGALLGFRASDGTQTFGYAPHVGCVKALMCSTTGRLASGGTDTAVRLFDLSKGIELGDLQEHKETVASLDFAGTSSLVTAGGDGEVCIWRCSDWELLLKFRAHKTGVTCLAAHPSGRLMASAGQDQTIRLWDLMRGTSAANISLDSVADVLDWAPGGKHIAALSSRNVVLVDTRTASLSTYREPARDGPVQVSLCAMCCLSDDVIMVGDDKGSVRALQASDGKVLEVCQLPSEAQRRGRVKGIARGSADKKGVVFAVGFSQGLAEVWHLTYGQEVSGAFQKLHAVETATRLTCLAYWSGPPAASSLANTAQIENEPADTEEAKTHGKRKKKQRRK